MKRRILLVTAALGLSAVVVSLPGCQQSSSANLRGGRKAQHFSEPSMASARVQEWQGERYAPIREADFTRPIGFDALSTFSIDVDTASYANVRRYLKAGKLPPADAVRIEELVNYFSYDYAAPSAFDVHPLAVDVASMPAPWRPAHRLVRVGIKARDVPAEQRPPANLVFLIDVSGSMGSADKLPLLKQSMNMLLNHLSPDDQVAIVTYAGASGVALQPTYCSQVETIRHSINRLRAAGSTNGGAGLELAYRLAEQNFVVGGVNRIILATDGDFNVGVQSDSSIVRLIEQKRQTGVYLSVLGFGTGNYDDSKMEKLSNAGNGNAVYIDTIREARKALVQEMTGTLLTVAKDVKIQVEFNPAQVQGYRLIGYENRALQARDFNDDRKDAGELGAGTTVTALYEVVPNGAPAVTGINPLKYQDDAVPGHADHHVVQTRPESEMLTVKVRYKAADGQDHLGSRELSVAFTDPGTSIEDAPADLKFASAVAGTGMILRGSPYRGNATLDVLLDLAEQGAGEDAGGYRGEFIAMMRRASELLPAEMTVARSGG